jgi:WhiB family redox-sensing transcriptional regulator
VPSFEEEAEAFLGTEPLTFKYEFMALDVVLASRPPAWFVDAVCRSVPDAKHVDVFFPETTTHGGNHLIPARKMCLGCPVRYECLEEGLEEPWGVWGGHSPTQRKRISSAVKKGSSLIDASKAIDARSRDAR